MPAIPVAALILILGGVMLYFAIQVWASATSYLTPVGQSAGSPVISASSSLTTPGHDASNLISLNTYWEGLR